MFAPNPSQYVQGSFVPSPHPQSDHSKTAVPCSATQEAQSLTQAIWEIGACAVPSQPNKAIQKHAAPAEIYT